MLTKQQAFDLAAEQLRLRGAPEDHVLVPGDDHAIETEFGWAFFYQSRKFLETREFGHMLCGNGPILVNKFDGTVKFTGSAKGVKHQIDLYTAEWRSKQRSESE